MRVFRSSRALLLAALVLSAGVVAACSLLTDTDGLSGSPDVDASVADAPKAPDVDRPPVVDASDAAPEAGHDAGWDGADADSDAGADAAEAGSRTPPSCGSADAGGASVRGLLDCGPEGRESCCVSPPFRAGHFCEAMML